MLHIPKCGAPLALSDQLIPDEDNTDCPKCIQVNPIPVCTTHKILACRECFPVYVVEKEREPRRCKEHDAPACLECWGPITGGAK